MLSKFLPEGSWCLYTEKYDRDAGLPVPGDAKLMLLDAPTLYAVGILIYSIRHYLDIADTIEALRSALKKGLEFLAVRNFYGHGFDAEHTAMHWLEIMHEREVIEFAAENVEFSPDFHAMLIGLYLYLIML